MAKRKPKVEPSADAEAPGRGATETVRVEADLARMLSIISIRRGKSVSEILSPHLRPWVEDLYRKTVKEMHEQLE